MIKIYVVKRATSNSVDDFVMCSSRHKAIDAILDNGNDKILAISWNNGDVLVEKANVSFNNWLNYIDRLARGYFDHDFPVVFIAQNCSYTIRETVI